MIKTAWKWFLGVGNLYFQCIKNGKVITLPLNAFISFPFLCQNNYLDRFFTYFLHEIFNYLLYLCLINFDCIPFLCRFLKTMFIIVLFFNAIFMLVEMEFQFTWINEWRLCERNFKGCRPPHSSKQKGKAFLFRIKIWNVKLVCLLNEKWECNSLNTGDNLYIPLP